MIEKECKKVEVTKEKEVNKEECTVKDKNICKQVLVFGSDFVVINLNSQKEQPFFPSLIIMKSQI